MCLKAEICVCTQQAMSETELDAANTVLEAASGEDDVVEDHGGDVWRYDETVLNELEDFLGKIDTGAEDEPMSEEDSQAANLLKEVNAELADAQKEIEQLKTENASLSRKLDAGPLCDDEEYLEAYDRATAAAKKTKTLWEDLKDTRAELAETTLTLYKVPESEHADGPKVPHKYGRLKLNKLALDVHLIGGESLELINKSKEGHQHVSRLDLSVIDEVSVFEDDKCKFKVKSPNGAYIMEAASAADAKSWSRAVQISIQVAKKRSAQAGK